MSFNLGNLKKPTPKKWEKVGKSLLRAGIALSGSAIIANHSTFAVIALTLCGMGEFMTNFFADD